MEKIDLNIDASEKSLNFEKTKIKNKKCVRVSDRLGEERVDLDAARVRFSHVQFAVHLRGI